MITARMTIVILQLTLLVTQIVLGIPLLCIPIVILAFVAVKTYWEVE